METGVGGWRGWRQGWGGGRWRSAEARRAEARRGQGGWESRAARVYLQQRGEVPRRGEDAHARLLVERQLGKHAAGVEAELELPGRRLHHGAQSFDGAAPHEALARGVRRVRCEVAERASELHKLLRRASRLLRRAAAATALQQGREAAQLRGAQRHRIVGCELRQVVTVCRDVLERGGRVERDVLRVLAAVPTAARPAAAVPAAVPAALPARRLRLRIPSSAVAAHSGAEQHGQQAQLTKLGIVGLGLGELEEQAVDLHARRRRLAQQQHDPAQPQQQRPLLAVHQRGGAAHQPPAAAAELGGGHRRAAHWWAGHAALAQRLPQPVARAQQCRERRARVQLA